MFFQYKVINFFTIPNHFPITLRRISKTFHLKRSTLEVLSILLSKTAICSAPLEHAQVKCQEIFLKINKRTNQSFISCVSKYVWTEQYETFSFSNYNKKILENLGLKKLDDVFRQRDFHNFGGSKRLGHKSISTLN